MLIDDEDLDRIQLESTHAIGIDRFVPADGIGWIRLDRPHCLSPPMPSERRPSQ